MKTYAMNRYLIHMMLMIFLALGYKVSGQESGYSLHVNKHYFLTGEQVYFSMYGNLSPPIPQGWPIYLIVFSMEKDHQKLIRAVKIRWEEGSCNGYLILPENILTGTYILGAFPFPLDNQIDPTIYTYLYVFNPKESDKIMDEAKGEMGNIISPDFNTAHQHFPDPVNISYRIEKESIKDSLLTFHGNVFAGGQVMKGAKMSVSLMDRRFYDSHQSALIESRNQPGIRKPPLTFSQNKWDSIRKEGSYLHGRILIDQVPFPYKKIYYFYQDDSLLFIDTYITDPNGNFRFSEPDLPDIYTLKLLTLPEPGKSYRFELNERLFRDSIYHLNVPDYHPENRDAFNQYAYKKYLIDQSYLNQTITVQETKSVRFMIEARPSHTIVLDDYVSFSTLAEILREIVPQVSVKYQDGRYEIRIFDARAKNYCCTGNPLIFINQEPYVDLQELMNMNTADIYSLEVIRPTEAILSFGDIGLNGILKINLREGIAPPEIQSRGKASFQIPGYQSQKEYQIQDLNADYPDFRSFLFWNGHMKTGPDGSFEFRFKPSHLDEDFMIVIKGITADKKLFETEMNVEFSDIH